MPTSTDSRRSSLFSLQSTAATSILSDDCDVLLEKSEDPPSPVLNWKPLLFSTAFTATTSTHLHFTAFPPHDLKTPLFEHLSTQAAEALLRDFRVPATMSFLAQPDSKIQCVDHIPFPPSLPRELIHLLATPDWEYFHVTQNSICIGLGSLQAGFDHYVAIRSVRQGLERYIFRPSGLSVHSICRIEDVGSAFEDCVPRETLFLREEVEIVCNKFFKRWIQSIITTEMAGAHERFRQEWDETIRVRWETTRRQEKIDLLA